MLDFLEDVIYLNGIDNLNNIDNLSGIDKMNGTDSLTDIASKTAIQSNRISIMEHLDENFIFTISIYTCICLVVLLGFPNKNLIFNLIYKQQPQ